MYSILGRMTAFGGPNQLVSRYAQVKRAQWESRIWDCLNGESDFIFRSPLVQLFDPQAARGYSMLKPLGTSRRDKTKDCWAEPFQQWLRFRGYFQGSAGWFADGDLRLYSPVPFDISHERLTKVVDAFREIRMGGAGVKMDCRSVLAFTRLLIESCHRKRRPREMVSALWSTRYKDMGKAYTVIGTDQFALPDWMDLHTDEHLRLWLTVLEEHETAIRRLTDSHSDECELLRLYRDTFQVDRQESIAALVRFLASYGSLVFRKRSQDGSTLPQFTLDNILPLLGASPECQTALETPGFTAVAAAIRSATFGAQGQRYYGNHSPRQVRNGLLASLQRAGQLGATELVAAVSEFIRVFNAEGLGRRNAGIRAAHIATPEMEDFERLVKRSPNTQLLTALLCGIACCHRGEACIAARDRNIDQALQA